VVTLIKILNANGSGITGARWGLDGAEAILKLRSLKVSSEFDDYWKFYEQQEFIKNHFNQYAEPTFLLFRWFRILCFDVRNVIRKFVMRCWIFVCSLILLC